MNLDKQKELLVLAQEYNDKDDYSEVERISREVLASLPTQKSDGQDWNEVLTVRMHALHQLRFGVNEKGNHAEALSIAENYLAIAKELGNKEYEARALGGIGMSYRNLENYPLGLEYLGQSLSIYEEIGDKAGMGRAYRNFANTYNQNLGDFNKGLEYCFKALAIAEELELIVEIANMNGGIGLVYGGLGILDKALEYNTKSLANYEEIGNKRMIAGTKVNIGEIHRTIGNYDKALEYYGVAIAELEEIGEKLFIAHATLNIGEVHRETGSFSIALEYYTKALAEYQEIGNKSYVAMATGIIGFVYSNQKFEGYDAAKAEEYLLKAVTMLEEVGANHYLFEILKPLAELYEQEEKWKESQITFKKYHLVKDEVQSEAAKKTALQLEMQKQIAEREKEIAIAKAKADAEMSVTTTLLHKVLPSSIANRLIKGEKVADYFQVISILFADIVGFTPIASKMPARKVLAFLNYVFGEFDRIIEKHGCEKIKTIGDGYMAVAGAPIECADHAERIARAAIEMMSDIELPEDIRDSLPMGSKFNIRIGINIGPAFGGIVGENRFVYDIYSDAVNTAARMESHGEPGRIHVSEDFAFHLQNRMDMTNDDLGGIVFEERNEIEIKGKGKMKTYFLEQNNNKIQ